MCGIVGMLDVQGRRAPDMGKLRAMMHAIAHRGPDGDGVFQAPGIALGHLRLAIIDLEHGAQPMTSKSNRHVMSFNGEIYNHRALGKTYGLPLTTRCDSEVLLELFEQQQEKTLDALSGMFAFAIWDQQQRRLFLARDRMGERPLYYGLSADGWLVFASEMSAMLASGKFDRAFDPASIKAYFTLGYVPDPQTIYQHIHRLPAACFLSISAEQAIKKLPVPQPYWRPKLGGTQLANEEELLSRLDKAVMAQTMADVPLGAFLSGGVDSSAIVSSMALHSDQPPTSFTISFPDTPNDDGDFAQSVAQQYHTRHFQQTITLDHEAMILDAARTYGEPFADSSALPTIEVCRAARKYVTVALSGDGADELFAGYRRYRLFAAEEKMRDLLPSFMRRLIFKPLGQAYPKLDRAPRPLRLRTTLQSLAEESSQAYLRAVSAILPERVHDMLDMDETDQPCVTLFQTLFHEADCADPLLAAQYCDLKSWLSGRMLVKTDRAAMASSLELRVPFLDHELVEWALQLPRRDRLHAGQGKPLLKRALNRRLAKDILYRPKKGFDMPIDRWLRGDQNHLVNTLLASPHWRESGFFKEKNIRTMAAKHKTGQMNYGQELWSMIMFDAFLQTQAD